MCAASPPHSSKMQSTGLFILPACCLLGPPAVGRLPCWLSVVSLPSAFMSPVASFSSLSVSGCVCLCACGARVLSAISAASHSATVFLPLCPLPLTSKMALSLSRAALINASLVPSSPAVPLSHFSTFSASANIAPMSGCSFALVTAVVVVLLLMALSVTVAVFLDVSRNVVLLPFFAMTSAMPWLAVFAVTVHRPPSTANGYAPLPVVNSAPLAEFRW
ncbi:hypothetical protein, conserved in T. vivax [Trypanosoma vivax Y486]|uniref:Uncharacterized protein n=1 Tax=Trypanosoma vivax (strain Y486) TaxID=1055687 RepID=F9WSS4_TRYVY|nr:hypothetical protein, conserved in T. vivax [Trypanosoma vivax Y486]|eukprot:CCD20613.1 hypothetical protein, conserved in T. vivax [Trypanosoma vivax Y486]